MKLVSAKNAENLTDDEVFKFIFREGFSTAEKIDFVSGRGVGLDIVRTVTTASKGRIDIKTEKDRFTRFSLIFLLSTAIIDGMIVSVTGTSYIVPVHNIIESLKIEKNMLSSVNGRVKVLDLRKEIIPLVELSEYFRKSSENGNGKKSVNDTNASGVVSVKAESSGIDVETGRSGGSAEAAGLAMSASMQLGVIVENSEKKKYALLVDEIIAKKEVVIKSLGHKFKKLQGISSGTVLHGGKIGFVLDIDKIVSFGSVKADSHE